MSLTGLLVISAFMVISGAVITIVAWISKPRPKRRQGLACLI